jgi:hypothetical protein
MVTSSANSRIDANFSLLAREVFLGLVMTKILIGSLVQTLRKI